MIEFIKEGAKSYLDVYTYQHDNMTAYKACKSIGCDWNDFDLLLFNETGRYCYHRDKGWDNIGTNLFSSGLTWDEVMNIVTLDIL